MPHRRLLKFSFALGLAALLFFLLLLHLGRFLDVSEPPVPSDLIVSLGGGQSSDRVRKALELYRRGYSKSGYIMINNCDYKSAGTTRSTCYRLPNSRYLMHGGVAKNRILFMHDAGNTMGELRFVKSWLKAHGMRSLIIVSSPPHLRRIRFLARLNRYANDGIHLTVVGSDPPWWDPDRWYANPVSRAFVVNELIKFPVNFVKYAILEPLGLLEPCRETCRPILLQLHRWYHRTMNSLRGCRIMGNPPRWEEGDHPPESTAALSGRYKYFERTGQLWYGFGKDECG